MALASGTLFNVRATATANNVNGGGFNPANTSFVTDWTATNANTSSPVISSATLSLVTADATAWIYIKSGTNWNTGGWYPIASVSGGSATINAAVGAGFRQDPTNPYLFIPTTVAGIASVASPTGGTIGFDFSFADTAPVVATDLAQVDGETLITSASNPFRRTMVANIFNLTTAGTGGFGAIARFEVANFVSAGSVNLDRVQSNSNPVSGQTGYLGGACNFSASIDAFFEELPPAYQIRVKSGTYTLSAAVNVSASPGTPALPGVVVGYASIPGDACNGANRPLIVCGSNAFAMSPETNCENLRFTTTSSGGIVIAANSKIKNCSAINSSSTADRVAWSCAIATNSIFIDCEGVSQNGRAWSGTTNAFRLIGCYAHDSDIGVLATTATLILSNCKFEANRTCAVDSASTSSNQYLNCTFYGRESQIGIGCRFTGASSTGHQIVNSIFYGLATGVLCSTQQGIDVDYSNVLYYCGANVSGWLLDSTALTATNPGFTGAAQISGSTATTSGSVLTQSGGDFSTVTDNVDYLHVISGTGVTVGRYLVTSHTSTTLTVNNALGTSSAGNVVYFVTTGHDLTIGTALKGLGGPNFSNMGIEDRSYIDPGCMQRQEATASGGGGAMIVRRP